MSSSQGADYNQSGPGYAPGPLRRLLAWLRRVIGSAGSFLVGLLPFLASFPRWSLFALACVLFASAFTVDLLGTVVPWNDPRPYFGHWLTPRRLFAYRALPAFDNATINSLEIVPVTDPQTKLTRNRVWIAGDAGLLAYSDDEGESWVPFDYDPRTGAIVKRAPSAESASQWLPGLSWQVEAAAPDVQKRPLNAAQSAAKPGAGTPNQTNAPAAIQRPAPNRGAQTPVQQSQQPPAAKPAVSPRRQPPAVTRPVAVPPESVLPQVSVPHPSAPPDLLRVEFESRNHSSGQVFASGGYVASTTDAGETWHPSPLLVSAVERHTGSTTAGRPYLVAPRSVANPLNGDQSTSVEISASYTLALEKSAQIDFISTGSTLTRQVGYSASQITSVAVLPHIYGIAGTIPTGQVWIAGADNSGTGFLYASADTGITWTRRFTAPRTPLRDVLFAVDGRTGFAAGDRGAIFLTRDLGAQWRPITLGAAVPGKLSGEFHAWQQPVRVPAPLTILLGLFGLLFVIPAVFPDTVSTEVPQGIASFTVSDAPVVQAQDDALGFLPVARAISGLLRNRGTRLPLTLAITAKWGRGKTSLMSFVQQELKAAGWRTVWFNAWHHQEELSLLAALLQTVRKKAPPGPLERGGLSYRARLTGTRILRWQTLWLAAACVVLYQAEAKVHDRYPLMYDCSVQYLYDVSGAVRPNGVDICPNGDWTGQQNAATPASAAVTMVQTPALPAAAAGAPKKSPQPAAGAATAAPETSSKAPEKHPESVGIIQFLMRLIFDAVREAELAASGGKSGLHMIPILALTCLVALFAIQILQSFGANPAALLTPETSKSSVSELDARSSFLESFRNQYGDVVGALGKYRLVIFIDDLDRCHPDKISEMLEAANYLMSAGPCALVMALEETAVVTGLGLSFARMAEELVELKPLPGAQPDILADARRKRLEFAGNYTEKLFQVIVQVPVIDPGMFTGVFSGRAAREMAADEIRRQQIRRIADLTRVPVAAIILAAIIYVGGTLLADWALPPVPDHVATAAPTTAAISASPPQSAPAPPGTLTGASTTSSAARPALAAQARVKPVVTPRYVPAHAPLPYRLFDDWRKKAAWLLLLVGLITTLAARRPPPVTGDSDGFIRALAHWGPVLADVNSSPRTAKRLLNRLRYLAMLERELAQKIDAATGAPAFRTLPETWLVAFGTVQLISPPDIEDAGQFAVFLADAARYKGGYAKPGRDAAASAWNRHESLFGAIAPAELEKLRAQFVNLSEGIIAR